MKDICMLMGFGAGLVAGALLYKHCEEAKKLVNKGEKAVKNEVETLKEAVKPQEKQKKQEKSQPQKSQKAAGASQAKAK